MSDAPKRRPGRPTDAIKTRYQVMLKPTEAKLVDKRAKRDDVSTSSVIRGIVEKYFGSLDR